MKWWAVLLLWLPASAWGIVHETGFLRGFLLDSCSACAYDNWLSHVSERLVRPNYNDYGPPNLDPVTNGFGGFTYITDDSTGDSTLARWRQVFDFAIAEEWAQVDSLLMRHEAEWRYELVRLQEPGVRRHYYLLRERLDSSYVDTNGDSTGARAVIGGFRNGWGVFVFNPEARHARAIVQVPHPEDDYMAPPVATEMFVRDGLAQLMIAGAGREVLWDTTFATYNNGLSLSDPSRNGRHPFAVATEAAIAVWDAPPVSEFVVIQLHSYDHNEHGPLGDMQISCFFDDHFPNPPMRDVSRHRDYIHALPLFPINGFDGDESVVTRVDEYVSLWSSPAYSYFGADTVALRSVFDFLGVPENQQGNACHANHDERFDTENFVHIELDEYPDALWQPTDFARWLPGAPPARLANFRLVIDYFAPFVTAVDSALTWHEVPDTLAPEAVYLREVSRVNASTVDIRWDGVAYDQHFDTYEIVYDTTELSALSPRVTHATSASYTALGDQHTAMQRFTLLTPPLERYRFALRARDMAGNVSAFTREWGIADSVIHDLTITVDGDSLRLNWTGAYYDSLYEVREYPAGLGGYYLLGVADVNHFAFVPTAMAGNRMSVIMVKRVWEE
ncbi:MAG: hypothetical protein IPK53_01590 [bacterium]|nr:hypothetical protein [bacterium]